MRAASTRTRPIPDSSCGPEPSPEGDAAARAGATGSRLIARRRSPFSIRARTTSPVPCPRATSTTRRWLACCAAGLHSTAHRRRRAAGRGSARGTWAADPDRRAESGAPWLHLEHRPSPAGSYTSGRRPHLGWRQQRLRAPAPGDARQHGRRPWSSRASDRSGGQPRGDHRWPPLPGDQPRSGTLHGARWSRRPITASRQAGSIGDGHTLYRRSRAAACLLRSPGWNRRPLARRQPGRRRGGTAARRRRRRGRPAPRRGRRPPARYRQAADARRRRRVTVLVGGSLDGRAWTSRSWPSRSPLIRSAACSIRTRAPRGWDSVAVAVADRHVAQDFVTIDERIDDQARRYPAFGASLEAARAPAHAMQADLAAAAGLTVDELEARLRAAWTRAPQMTPPLRPRRRRFRDRPGAGRLRGARRSRGADRHHARAQPR